MMNILILRLSSMGDVILAAPLFSFLCKRYPAPSVTLVTRSEYAVLFKDDPRLFEVVGLSSTAGELPGRIREKRWDLVIDLQNSRRSRSLLEGVASDSERKRFDKLHPQRMALLFLRRDRYPEQSQVALRYIGALDESPVTPADVPPLKLYFDGDECRRAMASLVSQTGGVERPSLALFPFGAWRNKVWPADRYIDVGRHFHEKGWNVAIFGGPADRSAAQAMSRPIGLRCVSFAGELSLYQCGVQLTTFSLALGNDTGLSHLSRACGVKTAVIFGPTTRHFGFYPYGAPPFRILETAAFCRPCHPHGGNFCFRFSRPCLRRISSGRAIAELEALSGE